MTILYEDVEQHARRIAPLLGGEVAVVASASALVEAVNDDPTETLVVLGPDAPMTDVVGFAEQCARYRPGMGILLLRRHRDGAIDAQVRRAGVHEIVDVANPVAIREACNRLRDGLRPPVTAAAQPAPAQRAPAHPAPAQHAPGRHNGAAGTAAPNGVPAAYAPPAVPIGSAAVPAAPVSPHGAAVPAPPVPPVPPHGPAPVPPHGAHRPPPEPPDREGGGKVVAVFSAKGGCGTSVFATNLAVALAAGGAHRVCLVDLDLAFGDIAIMTQLSPDRTIADAIPVADRIDETGLRALLVPYRPGIDVLLAPVQPALAEQIGRDLVAELLHLARGMFDIVVVDCASSLGEHTLAALDAAHQYLLITTPELPALKSLRVTLDTFDLLDYRREDRIIVLNRADSKVGLSSSDAERVLRVPIHGYVPSSRDVPTSVNRGTPLVLDHPNSPVGAALRELARHFTTAAHAPQSRGLRGRIRSGGRGKR